MHTCIRVEIQGGDQLSVLGGTGCTMVPRRVLINRPCVSGGRQRFSHGGGGSGVGLRGLRGDDFPGPPLCLYEI